MKYSAEKSIHLTTVLKMSLSQFPEARNTIINTSSQSQINRTSPAAACISGILSSKVTAARFLTDEPRGASVFNFALPRKEVFIDKFCRQNVQFYLPLSMIAGGASGMLCKYMSDFANSDNLLRKKALNIDIQTTSGSTLSYDGIGFSHCPVAHNKMTHLMQSYE